MTSRFHKVFRHQTATPSPYTGYGGLSNALLHLWPEYQSYVTSFTVIGLYWISHHHYFRFIRRYDYTFVALNIGLLMCIASLPFATSVLDNYGSYRSAVAFKRNIGNA